MTPPTKSRSKLWFDPKYWHFQVCPPKEQRDALVLKSMEILLLRVSGTHPPIVSHALSTAYGRGGGGACCPGAVYSLWWGRSGKRERQKKRNRGKDRKMVYQDMLSYNVLVEKEKHKISVAQKNKVSFLACTAWPSLTGWRLWLYHRIFTWGSKLRQWIPFGAMYLPIAMRKGECVDACSSY